MSNALLTVVIRQVGSYLFGTNVANADGRRGGGLT